MENEKQKFVQEALELAHASLDVMCKRLGINPECFNYLFDENTIKISILSLNHALFDHAVAVYFEQSNEIIVDNDFIDYMIQHLKNNSDNPREQKKVMNTMATTLLHELLHANRNMMLENAITEHNIDTVYNDLIEKFKLKKQGYDIEQYEAELEKMIQNNSNLIDFDLFIPIKMIIDENKTTSIIAYNKETMSYHIFDNCQFVDLGDTLYDIGIKLNENKDLNSSILYQPVDTEDSPTCGLASFYYYPKKDFAEEKEDQTILDYMLLATKDYQRVLTRLEKSEGLEEALTEAIASTIVLTRNKDKLDLDEVVEKLSNNSLDISGETALYLNSILGEDIIKWFLLSARDDVYHNMLEAVFEDDYDTLVRGFSDLYNNENPLIDVDSAAKSVKSIIENQKVKQKSNYNN